MAPVEITRRSVDFVERKEPANLWVLVQARAGTVTAPVARMGDKMMREGFIALFTMLAMICMLWFVVVRGLRLPKRLRSASGLGGGRTGESATDGEGSLPASR